ncbi:hypothetical protein Tdes44962_MAKER09550 [Teratosphaeria destructans]|uniref:Uncharacterized protein n=1 Tax=Teratosphaeria destructans TaxID=418781 RepID=A0A9W7SSR3_9PEZI|nr:hypothetical protein Tdes44962_MAKER09550 [Teratosphaeria destructans]
MRLAYALVLSAASAAAFHDVHSPFSSKNLAVRDAAKPSLEERAPGTKCFSVYLRHVFDNQDKFCQGTDYCICNNGKLECGQCRKRVRLDCDCGTDMDGNVSCYKEEPDQERFECH